MALQSLVLAQWKSNQVVLPVEGWWSSRQCRLLLPERPFPEAQHGCPDKLPEELLSARFAFTTNYFCRSYESREELLPNC